jgi:hypothetical protein
VAGAVEIVCDESGYEGDRLVGSTTALFAHAAVLISEPEAAAILAELRARIRSPATQYKANHLLRARHRDVLEWFLGPDAPLRGRASVFVVDKTHYVLGRTVELLLGDGTLAPHGMLALPETDLLHRYVTRPSASTLERRLPELANGLLRRRGAATPFLTALTELRRDDASTPPARDEPHSSASPATSILDGPPGGDRVLPPVIEVLLRQLAAGAARAMEYRAALAADPEAGAALDPLTPAILAAVTRWDAGHGVTLAHDRQIALSGARVARLREWSGGRLTAVRFLVAEDEPRIQLADILAGTVRALLSGGEAAPVRPFVDPHSLLPRADPPDSWP